MRSGNLALVVLNAVVMGTFQLVPSLAQEQRQNKDTYLQQSPGANTPRDIDEWRKGESRGGLVPYPMRRRERPTLLAVSTSLAVAAGPLMAVRNSESLSLNSRT